MSEQGAKHGPRQDEYLEQQTRGGGHVEEFHQVEPGALDDEPDRMSRPTAGAPGEGMSQHDIDVRSRIAASLGRQAFPGDRDRLLDVAATNQADDAVLANLRRLPAGAEFGNVQDVVRALGVTVEPPEAPR